MALSEAWLQEIIGREIEGVELVALERAGSKDHKVVRLYIDRDGGVDHELCGLVSEVVSKALDEAEEIRGSYALEVSSPGLERPLSTREHFESQVGKMVYVKTRLPVEGAKVWQGRLLKVTSEAVFIEDGAKLVTIQLGDVTKAHVIFEFE